MNGEDARRVTIRVFSGALGGRARRCSGRKAGAFRAQRPGGRDRPPRMTTRIEGAPSRPPLSPAPAPPPPSRLSAERLAGFIASAPPSAAFVAELFREKSCPERLDACVPVPETRPELFVQDGPSEVDAIDPRDVRQNRIGDCYLLAAMQSLAETARGRDVLRGMIRERRDAAGTHYDVTFHVPRFRFFGELRPVTVTVEPSFIAPAAARPATRNGTREVWVAVVEAAFAKLKGSYAAIDGGDCARALECLTGRKARTTTNAASLARELAAQKPVTMRFEGKKLRDHGLVADHAYAVAAVYQDARGAAQVQLRNPWGKDHPPPLPLSAFAEVGAQLAIGELP